MPLGFQVPDSQPRWIFLDSNREVCVYAGWDASTDTPTLPTQVVHTDWADGYIETLTRPCLR